MLLITVGAESDDPKKEEYAETHAPSYRRRHRRNCCRHAHRGRLQFDDSKDSASSAASVAASAAGSAASAATEAGSSAASAAAKAAKNGVELEAADGSTVKLTGPIAVKYAESTDEQKSDLGKPMTGDDASGTSESGVVFQQFDGGVITAKNNDSGTPAYITWGKIRDAWNVKRDSDGQPSADGKGGSNGPLGAATSDETVDGDMKKSTFEHGEITFNTSDDKVTVTVNGKEVDAE
ncbi:hypothetical protein GOHSU_18_00030 [Gordonia hirsuta DSM 44140 = NBRC 16056]|uniref:LGFP repeat-containing protein n=1 Tax=Gordonia hirsuta DSM 44140 = NBRC 16056 TaxID=1121927 RepID=L7LB35_9ACTN|nr:hypothetical protein GOHSU_18_00030 [Gordonia hirsuta DSM 44140 = NBRC 16056]